MYVALEPYGVETKFFPPLCDPHYGEALSNFVDWLTVGAK